MQCGKIVHFINCLFVYLYLACTLYACQLKRRLLICIFQEAVNVVKLWIFFLILYLKSSPYRWFQLYFLFLLNHSFVFTGRLAWLRCEAGDGLSAALSSGAKDDSGWRQTTLPSKSLMLIALLMLSRYSCQRFGSSMWNTHIIWRQCTTFWKQYWDSEKSLNVSWHESFWDVSSHNWQMTWPSWHFSHKSFHVLDCCSLKWYFTRDYFLYGAGHNILVL